MSVYSSVLILLLIIFLGSRSLCAETQGRRQGYQRHTKRINDKLGAVHLDFCLFHSPFQGVKESDTGLASPNLWDLLADRQRMGEDHSLQVARCTKIIPVDPKLAEAAKAVNPLGAVQGQKGADEQDKYVINIKQIAKFVVGLGDRVAPTDIEEGMRVG